MKIADLIAREIKEINAFEWSLLSAYSNQVAVSTDKYRFYIDWDRTGMITLSSRRKKVDPESGTLHLGNETSHLQSLSLYNIIGRMFDLSQGEDSTAPEVLSKRQPMFYAR